MSQARGHRERRGQRGETVGAELDVHSVPDNISAAETHHLAAREGALQKRRESSVRKLRRAGVHGTQLGSAQVFGKVQETAPEVRACRKEKFRTCEGEWLTHLQGVRKVSIGVVPNTNPWGTENQYSAAKNQDHPPGSRDSGLCAEESVFGGRESVLEDSE